MIANAATGSIFRSYNLILDKVAEREDLEALVLLHQDTEIVDPGFCASCGRRSATRGRRRRAASARSGSAASRGGRAR